jgi:glycosyltransferase involved in cell wall biosynthesis
MSRRGGVVGIVISCFSRVGGIGIANVLFHTVRAAYRAGILDAVICYGNHQKEIPARFIRPIRFQPAKVVSFLRARYYYTLKRITLDRAASRYIRRNGCDIFHGWTTECIRSLQEARRIEAKTIVERPAPHPSGMKRLMREEYERWGVSFSRDDGYSLLRKIDTGYRHETVAPEEFELADRVIVQSEFGVDSFVREGFPRERLVLLPRAADVGDYPAPAKKKAGFRVLFVGMVCLRKGFLDLARAWVDLALPGAELLVVGQIHEEIVPLLKPYRNDSSIRFIGHVRGGVHRYYAQSSVFVLPSVVEGSAKTTYEAMAAGLPVITTVNAGSVVRDGIDGYIVPIRNPAAIRDRLLSLYENRETLREMGESARKHVADYSWGSFEKRLADLYRELMGTGTAGREGVAEG